MLLAVDIGNSSISMAVFDLSNACNDNPLILLKTKISSDAHKRMDEYLILIHQILSFYEIDVQQIPYAIISSVVPKLTPTIYDAVQHLIGHRPLLVSPGIKTGLNIKIDNPAELGSDLVANTIAALSEMSGPFVIVDMGTATVLSIIDANNAYIGTIILSGVNTSISALANAAAQLPYVAPEQSCSGLIGTNTIDSIRSGVIYGDAFMLDGFIDKIKETLQLSEIPVLATGEFAKTVVRYCRHKIVIRDDLTLLGLYRLFEQNRRFFHH